LADAARAPSENSSDNSRRTCVVTGFEAEPEAMLRFALSPEGVVTPDIHRRLPGRGVWTQLDINVVAKAVQRKAFSRGFKNEAKADATLPELVDRLLEDAALRLLSFANKAGLVVSGAMKVESAIRGRKIFALLQASDGAPDGAAKLDRLVRGVFGERETSVARINLFASCQLDLALGRSNVIHAALSAGPTSAAFLVKAGRLVQYRAGAASAAKADTHAVVGIAASSASAEVSEN
jgi:uncharacterized protein